MLLLTLPGVSWCRNTLEVEPAVTFPHPGYSKLSWFVHITDIHVSSWEDATRQEQVSCGFSPLILLRVLKRDISRFSLRTLW